MGRGAWEKEREGRIREKECEKSRERPKEEKGGGREEERERGRWKREMDGGGEWSGERKEVNRARRAVVVMAGGRLVASQLVIPMKIIIESNRIE